LLSFLWSNSRYSFQSFPVLKKRISIAIGARKSLASSYILKPKLADVAQVFANIYTKA
jgi:hypothetical protein